MRQGEKLDSMDQRLDEVNNTLTATQKNLNSVKSIFGGLKNKFGWGNSFKAEKVVEKPITKSTSSSKGFDKQQQQAQPKAEFAKISGSSREEEINQNLEGLSQGLTRLTALAKDMSFELDRQNPVIDRLGGKVAITNARIDDQNKQMKTILK